MSRRLPPYGDMLGVTVSRDAGGAALFIMPFSDAVVGRPGFVHGGALAGLLEIAAIGTLFDSLAEEPAVQIKPINVSVDFMRGARERDTFAAATVTRIGSRIANVEAFAWQEARDKPVAGARMNLMLRRS